MDACILQFVYTVFDHVFVIGDDIDLLWDVPVVACERMYAAASRWKVELPGVGTRCISTVIGDGNYHISRGLAEQLDLELGAGSAFGYAGSVTRFNDHESGGVIILDGEGGRGGVGIELISTATGEGQLEGLIRRVIDKIIDRNNERIACGAAGGNAYTAIAACRCLGDLVDAVGGGNTTGIIGRVRHGTDRIVDGQPCGPQRGGGGGVQHDLETARFAPFIGIVQKLQTGGWHIVIEYDHRQVIDGEVVVGAVRAAGADLQLAAGGVLRHVIVYGDQLHLLWQIPGGWGEGELFTAADVEITQGELAIGRTQGDVDITAGLGA